MPRLRNRDFQHSGSFNGSSSCITVPTPTGIPIGTNARAFSVWVNLTSNALGTVAELHSNSAQSVSFLVGQTASIYYFFSDRVNAGNNLTITAAKFNKYIGVGRPVLLTWLVTTTSVSLYSFTDLVQTSALGTALNTGAINSLFIGKGQSPAQADIQFYTGEMNDLRFYDGTFKISDIDDYLYKGRISSSTISRYNFVEDDLGKDLVGANNGTATSMTTSSRTPFKGRFAVKKDAQCVYVNGVDGVAGNAVSVPYNVLLSPTAEMTVEVEFTPYAGKYFVLTDNSTNGVTDSFLVSVLANGSLSFYSTIGGVAKNILNTTKRVTWGERNVLSASYNGSKVQLFLNNSKIGEAAATGSMGVNTGSLRFGAYYTGGIAGTLKGYLHIMRLYSKGCTLKEHLLRYRQRKTSTRMTAALVLDLDTENISGTTIPDRSGNGFNATMGASASASSVVAFMPKRSRASGREVATIVGVDSAASTGSFTIADNNGLLGADTTTTITVTDWTAMAAGVLDILGAVQVTEGVDFVANVSNDATATDLAAAIDTAAGGPITTVIGTAITITLGGEDDGGQITWDSGGLTPTTATLTGGFDKCKFTIAGIGFTFPDDLPVGTDAADTVLNMISAINTYGIPTISVSADGATMLIEATTPGVAGDAITLAVGASGGVGPFNGAITASGSTLTGGVDGVIARARSRVS